MAEVLILSRCSANGEEEHRRVTFNPDGTCIMIPLLNFESMNDVGSENARITVASENEDLGILDFSHCFIEHNLDIDEYINDIEQQAAACQFLHIPREPPPSENEIARMDQEYVLKLEKEQDEMNKMLKEQTICITKIESIDLESPELPVQEEDSHAKVEEVEIREETNNQKSVMRRPRKFKDPVKVDDNETMLITKVEIPDPEDLPCIQQIKHNNETIRALLKTDDAREEPAPRPFSCNDCNQSFKSATALQRHTLKHYNEELRNRKIPKLEEEIWRCIPCGRVFPDQSQIAIHIITMHSADKSVPNEDNKPTQINDNDSYKIDQVEVVPKTQIAELNVEDQIQAQCELVDCCTEELTSTSLLQCEFCECVFVDNHSLFEHSKRHRTERNYECLNCDKEFSSYGQAIAHWQGECSYTKAETTFTLHKSLCCNVCERKFVGWDQLYNHRYKNRHMTLKMAGTDNFQCYQCDQCCHLSSSFSPLMEHRRNEHPRSLRAAELAKKTHGQRSFLCDICGKAYTQSSHLWQHLRFHQGIKPFACNITGCDRRFTIRPDLNDHIRKSHTGERPFHCTECDKRFLTGSVYYQHRLIHRGDRRYACNECDKKFYRADALKNHSRIHSGEKPYRCEICGRCFRQRGDRDKHIKVRHERNDQEGSQALNSYSGFPIHNSNDIFIKNIDYPKNQNGFVTF